MPVKQDEHSVTITSGDASAKIALHGASVYSWIAGGTEMLFTSSKSSIEGPAAIRGGIPVVWPVFGPPPKDDPMFNRMKQHGVARISKWTFAGSEGASARFSASPSRRLAHAAALKPNESIRAVFEKDFSLEYTVSLVDGQLKTELRVHNPSSSETLPFQTLFHTYFRLYGVDGPSDPSVTVSPLKGLALVDKVADAAHSTESRDALVFDGEVDRVYADVPSTLKLTYASGGLEISTVNLPDAVVWNPHKAKVRRR